MPGDGNTALGFRGVDGREKREHQDLESSGGTAVEGVKH